MTSLTPAVTSVLVAYALSAVVAAYCFAHGAIELRIEGATRTVDAQPSDPALYLRRSDLHREHRDWTAAEEDIAAAEALDRKNPNLLYHRALLLRDKRELSPAADLLSRFLGPGFDVNRSTVPRSRAHAELGRVLGNLGQWRSAADQYSLAIEHADRPVPQLYISLVGALEKTGDPDWEDEALRGLDQGIDRLGTGSILPDYAIDIELDRDDFDGALRRIERRIQAPGYRLTALVEKAEVLEMSHRKAAALGAYMDAQRVLDALPTKVQSRFAMRSLADRVAAGKLRMEKAGASEPAVGPGVGANQDPS